MAAPTNEQAFGLMPDVSGYPGYPVDRATPDVSGVTIARPKKLGRPKGSSNRGNGGTITVQDIEAVKALVDRISAVKIEQLVRVLEE
ncbi:hypothetical protein AYO44_18560 [Planctomycetaceae bacterium SCGC AG-212-F19]|nr:hypothetical protein AYO44_18560 [Planctomycetaceae bacterium SCGC AG-212-F19]